MARRSDDVREEIDLMRVSDITRALRIGRSTWWRGVADGRFPQPIRFGRCTAWRRADIRAMLDRLAREQAA